MAEPSTAHTVVASYLTLAGSSLGRADLTVDITEQSGVIFVDHPTEHLIHCNGCGGGHHETWGFDAWHDEFGKGPQPDFDATGQRALPAARAWAQSHAETCRAIPGTA